jgi:hypothetical protein
VKIKSSGCHFCSCSGRVHVVEGRRRGKEGRDGKRGVQRKNKRTEGGREERKEGRKEGNLE